jgi:hypothetical protein
VGAEVSNLALGSYNIQWDWDEAYIWWVRRAVLST